MDATRVNEAKVARKLAYGVAVGLAYAIWIGDNVNASILLGLFLVASTNAIYDTMVAADRP